MTRASRRVPDGTGGEARKEPKGDRSSRQVPPPGREGTEEAKTGPELPRPDDTGAPGGSGPGTLPDGTGQEGPSAGEATGTRVQPGRRQKDRTARETGRVTREWLIRNALFVEYEDRNILGEIDSWPEPEGGFEVGLSREDVLAAGLSGGARDSWIAIEPEKHGIGGFCTRSRDDPGGNAR
jgi:hypothetical protein